MFFTFFDSPIGRLTLYSAKENCLSGLYIDNQKYFPNEVFDLSQNDNLDVFNLVKRWLDIYFSGKNPFDISNLLHIDGTYFRKLVWKKLLEIPYGETLSYSDLAKKVAFDMNKENMSAQAIGGAVSHNPISIIIPCHRVMGKNGNLVGYAGGVDIKQKLLNLEKNRYTK